MNELIKSIFHITTTKIFISLLSGILFASGSYIVSINKDTEEEISEDEVFEKNQSATENKKLKYHKRVPASISTNKNSKTNSHQSTDSPRISDKNEENYNSTTNQTEYFNSGSNLKTRHAQPLFSPDISPTSNLSSPFYDSNQPSNDNNKKDSPTNSTVTPSGVLTDASPDKDSTNNPKNTKSNTTSDSNNSSPSSSSPVTNSCSTDILAGTFGNPFGVTITCTHLSNIKYCLSKDTCCDPKVSGTDYTTTITIGAENGNFCLSFFGDSESGGLTEVVQNNYTINNTFPNLNVGTPKTFYQTTELSGDAFITSSDFGKANHYAGQINFKSNDPTPTGLDYSCQEIAENDHLTLLPIPSTTLSLFNISALLPSNEITIPFREDKLDYGINFLSSFIKNNSYIVPLYSCSTTQITLEDFNYFESTMSQASNGDNNVREFEGQFSSYGFFEEDAQVFRGPAGKSSNEKNGTFLKSGLLGIFY